MSKMTDRIEKTVFLQAPLERVWGAVSDAAQFGEWFGMKVDGRFAEGRTVSARIAPTKVDPKVAELQKPHAGMPFELFIESVEPMRLLSFRWHPYAVDPDKDYSHEPTTLVAFELEAVPGGTRLTITESGFDAIPADRRAEAFESNEHGWALQTTLIEKYLARPEA